MKIFRLLGLLCLCMALLLGCGLPKETTEARIRTITDGLGLQVEVPVRPQRIVTLDIGATEITMLLIGTERLVGVSYFMDDPGICNLSAEAQAVPARVERNIEHIVELHPDLVIASSPIKEEVVTQLLDLGIPVFQIERPTETATIVENIRAIGSLLQEEEKAAALIAAMQADLDSIRDAVREVTAVRPPARVLRISMTGPSGGAGTVVDAIIREAGCINVAAEKGLHEGLLSREQFLTSEAEWLMMPTWDFRSAHGVAGLREKYLADPAIVNVPAVAEGNFLYIPDYYTAAQTPYRVFAVAALAEEVYGIRHASRLEALLPAGTVRSADWRREVTTESVAYNDGL